MPSPVRPPAGARPGAVVRAGLVFAVGASLACGGGSVTSPPPPPPPPPAPVATVSVTAPGTGLVPGQTATLAAVTRDAAGNVLTGRPVTWSTSAETVASVTDQGVVTGVSPGTATLTAASEGRTGSAVVSVGEGGMVGPQGGTLTAGGGSFTIQFPAGSVPAPTPIAIAPVATPPNHPGLVAGSAWQVGPEASTLALPASVTIQYDAARLPTGAQPLLLSVRRFAGTAWSLLEGGVLDVGARRVSGATAALGIVGVVAPAATGVTTGGFDDGTTQGWVPLAGIAVTPTATAARSGAGGLAVTGRTAEWQGPALNALAILRPGAHYQYRAWVRMAPGAAPAEVRLTMEWRRQAVTRFEFVVPARPVTSTGWVLLEGRYSLPVDLDFARLKVETVAGTEPFHFDDFSIEEVDRNVQRNIPSLHETLAGDFRFGTALNPDLLTGPHRDLVVRHFNSITPGNALKWDATEPVEGQFRWAGADSLVDFAQEHGLQVRGHTLVWHLQTPAWVFQDSTGQPLVPGPAGRALLLARLERHIRALGQRYAGTVRVWDVLNEVIDETQPDGLRRSPWYQIIGPDYIRRALIVAREAFPDARLVINEYLTEVPAKRDALFRLVADLKAEGVPLDGVGHQFHVSNTFPQVTQVEQAIQRFISLGVDQEVTELDMTIYQNLSESFGEAPTDRLLVQAERVQALFEVFRRQAAHLSTVTVWGPSDDTSWLNFYFVRRNDWPLLFDWQLQAKPAYWAIVDPQFIGAAPLAARVSGTAGR